MSMLSHNEHVGLLKHNNPNLPLILGELQMPLIPDALFRFFFKVKIDVVRALDNQWVLKFALSNEFWMSI